MTDEEIYRTYGCGHLECRLNKMAVEHYEKLLSDILAVVENIPSAQLQQIEKMINDALEKKTEEFASLFD